MRGGLVELQPIVCGAMQIPKNAFDDLHVGVARGMHEEAHLLNDIGNVWACKSEILECTSKATVMCRVGEEGASVRG